MLYLSYTREDALLALRLAEDLAALGVDVWLDLDELGPEADWSAALDAAIAASEGVILVLSPEAMRREHIRRELRQIFQAEKPLYLAVARPSPWREWLQGLPFADFTQDYEAGLNALLLVLTGEPGSADEVGDDPAEAFLRAAEDQKSRPQKPHRKEQEEQRQKRETLLGRLRRRFH